MEQISRRTVLSALGLAGATAGLAACGDDEPSTDPIGSSTHYVDGSGDSGSGDSGESDDAGDSGEDSPTSAAGQGDMETVELAAPDELRDRWAAFAAVWVGAGVSTQPNAGPRAEDGDWVYEMELGEWAYLVRFKDGRAVLAGQSNPDITRSPQQETTARKNLPAGGPKWWSAIEDVLPKQAVLGFVMGWDGKAWKRPAGAPSEGGFDKMTFYPESQEATGGRLVAWGTDGDKEYGGESKVIADRVISAGPKVTSAQLKRLGPGMRSAHLPAAVKTAAAFAAKGKH